MPKKFTPEFRERAVRMVFDRQATEGGPRAASIRVVAESLCCGPETLRAWCNQAITASKATPAPATDESLGEENRRLRRELAEARRANEMADSSGQRNISCGMGQSLTTGGSGCRASTVISAGSRSSWRSGCTRG
ncbi:MAG: hypothetical protein DI630_37245, partial [Gordonia sp. (in: high G+C Gram-positive bacteria)]